jgi:hypothetical protein
VSGRSAGADHGSMVTHKTTDIGQNTIFLVDILISTIVSLLMAYPSHTGLQIAVYIQAGYATCSALPVLR